MKVLDFLVTGVLENCFSEIIFIHKDTKEEERMSKMSVDRYEELCDNNVFCWKVLTMLNCDKLETDLILQIYYYNETES